MAANSFSIVLLCITLTLSAGCRTEIRGVTSINEAADYMNDPTVTIFPVDKKRLHYSRNSDLSKRAEIVGRVSIVNGDLHSEHPTDFQVIRIHDESNSAEYLLTVTPDSFAADLGYNLAGQLAKLQLDTPLPTDTTEIKDEHIIYFGPPN